MPKTCFTGSAPGRVRSCLFPFSVFSSSSAPAPASSITDLPTRPPDDVVVVGGGEDTGSAPSGTEHLMSKTSVTGGWMSDGLAVNCTWPETGDPFRMMMVVMTKVTMSKHDDVIEDTNDAIFDTRVES